MAEGENIGSLNFDVSVNIDTLAQQTAETVSAQIKEGLQSGAEAAKKFEEVIFEISDSFTQVRDEVKKYYDISADSFEKLSDAQRFNQSEFLKLSEARGTILSDEQKEWLRQYEERLQKFRDERQAIKDAKDNQQQSSEAKAPVERSARSIIGDDYAAVLEEAEAALKSYDETTKAYYNSIAKTEQRLSEVKAAQKALNAEYSAGRISLTDYKSASASLSAQEDLLSNTIRALNEGQKAFQSKLADDAGQIPKLKQTLSELQDQYEQLTAEELKSAQGKELAAKITAVKTELNGLKPEKLNETTEKAVSALTRLRQLKNELANPNLPAEEYEKLVDEATLLENRIRNVNKELKLGSANNAGLQATGEALRGVIGGFTALQGVIGLVTEDDKELQKTLLTVTSAMSVLQGVQEFSAAITKAGGLNQYLLSVFTKGTTAAIQEQIIATEELAAVQAIQTETTTATVVATEAGAVAAGELAVAETAQAIATVEAAGALGTLTAAMAENPATVLLVAITAIVGAIYAFSSSSKEAAEKQLLMNEALGKANELLAKLADLYNESYRDATKNAENAVTLANAQGKSELVILDLRKKAIEAKRTENIALLSSLGYNYDSNREVEKGLGYLKAQLESRQEEEHALLQLQAVTGKLTEADEARLKLLESQIKNTESLYQKLKTANDAINDANTKARELQAEKDKKIHDDELKSAVSSADAKLTLVRKNSKAELDAQLDLIEKKRIADQDNPNLTAGERTDIDAKAQKARNDAFRQYAILILNNEKSLLQARLDFATKGSVEEALIRKQLIDKQTQIELKAEGVTAQKRTEIETAAKKSKSDIDRDFYLKQLNDQKSLINATLATAKEGSAFELQLKQDLINKQVEIDETALGLSAERKKEIEATAAKAIAELIRKFAQDNSEAEINIRIAGINYMLDHVQKGSERELQLKKDLIDQKAALESAAAVRTEKNEVLLSAKLQLINSKVGVDKRKEDNDFADKKTERAIKQIENDANKLKAPLEKILADPFAKAGEKYNAQLDILRDNVLEFTKKQKAYQDQIDANVGDVGKAKQEVERLGNLIAKTNAQIDNLKANRLSDMFKEIAADVTKVGSALESLGSAISETNEGLGDTLQTMGEIASMAGTLLNAFAQFASGNIIGGVVSTISLIVSVFSLASKARASEKKAAEDLLKFQQQVLIGEIDTNIQYRERLRIQQQINKTKLEGLKAEADQLAKNRAQSLSDYTRIFAQLQNEQFIAGQSTEKYGGFLGIGRKTRAVDDLESLAGKSYDDLEKLFNSNQLTDKAKQLFQELQKLKQEGADIDQQLLDIQEQAKELFTGTTADSITDSIVDGFKNGMRSAADFADNFEDLMRDAIFNSLKYQTLEPALKSFYDNFSDFTQSGGVLTAEEIEKLRKTYGDIINAANAQFQNLQQITGIGFTGSSGANSLQGAIKGITSDQAQLLAGQFGGLRITAAEQLAISSQGLSVLQGIENNTSYIPKLLKLWEEVKLNGLKIK